MYYFLAHLLQSHESLCSHALFIVYAASLSSVNSRPNHVLYHRQLLNNFFVHRPSLTSLSLSPSHRFINIDKKRKITMSYFYDFKHLIKTLILINYLRYSYAVR